MGNSLNGVVIYKSRYGATQQYAEWIRKELRIPLIDPERLDDPVLAVCDLVVIGTPVYRGKMLIRDWLWQNQQRLRGKRLFFFIVCTHFSDREKQMTMIRENIPGGMLASCEAWFLPGKVIVADLSGPDALYLDVANLSEEDRAKRDAATRADDAVQEGNILPLVKTVRSFAGGL
jgi:hypothetical protein